MINATLQRIAQSEAGTEGKFSTLDGGFSCFTLELPWRDNRHGVSRILPGSYLCHYTDDARPAHKGEKVYHLLDVPGRDGILIHSGNLAGDTTKGLLSHVKGCILVGAYFGFIPSVDGKTQRAILESRFTVKRLSEFMEEQDFTLSITDEFPGGVS